MDKLSVTQNLIDRDPARTCRVCYEAGKPIGDYKRKLKVRYAIPVHRISENSWKVPVTVPVWIVEVRS